MKNELIQILVSWLIYLHIFAGAVALCTFVIPLVSKKGGGLHVKVGKLYVYSMAFVVISSLIITPWRAFFDSSRTTSSISFSIFLFFIAILTATALWSGLSVLKFKQRESPSHRIFHIGPPILLLILGFATQVLGIFQKNLLLIIFPFVSYFIVKDQLQYWLKKPDTKMHWWYFHMNNMITACIATVTAFLVTALPRIFPDNDLVNSPVLWVAPGLILGFVAKKWTAQYKVRFS